MSARRSASVGALPLEKKHFVSRNESSSGATLDVRCACQYFQSDSLLPERINPVDSRPTSKLDFHHDVQCPQFAMQEGVMEDRNVKMQIMPSQLPLDRRLMAGERVVQPEPDRFSVRSGDRHRPWDQVSASVDLSFVEKYPELEETARTRGLVVRSISDDDPNVMPGKQAQRRFTSVDRLGKDPETLSMHSVRSLRRISRSPSKQDLYIADINIAPQRAPYGRREQRSVSGSRRSSNMDLSAFPPQINVIIPTPLPQMTAKPPSFTPDLRSPSVEGTSELPKTYSRDFTPIRSTSPPGGLGFGIAKPPTSLDYMRPEENKENISFYNQEKEVLPQNRSIDMSKYKAIGDGKTTVDQLIPQTISPTSTQDHHTLKEMSPLRTSSPARVDFRNAKPPISADYMRPDESQDPNMSYQFPGEVLPQNRPIDMSKYRTSPEASTIVEHTNISSLPEKPLSPRKQTVAQPEAPNLLQATDNIQIERTDPTSVAEVATTTFQLEEKFDIHINTVTPQVDIDKVIQEEEEKIRKKIQARSRSTSPSRHFNASSPRNNGARSPNQQLESLSVDVVQLAEGTHQNLKRAYSPEHQLSPTEIKKTALNDKNSEDPSKPSYTTRFKNFFSGKPKDEADFMMASNEKSPSRERSPSPAPARRTSIFSSMFSKDKSPTREKSPSPAPTTSKFSSMFSKEKSPMRGKSPSPTNTTTTASKFMSMFSKEKPTAISVVSGTNAAITNKAHDEPMSIKVVETFSLKVDEMDQYMCKPAKPPPAAQTPSKTPSVPKSLCSNEEFVEPEKMPINVEQAFVPVIIGRSAEGSSQFLADKRTSHSELSSQDRGLEIRSRSKEATIHHHPELQGKPLFSAPIMMDSSGSLNRSCSVDRRIIPMHGMRSPSEQPPPLQYKDQRGDFYDGRTQSTDRHRLGGSQDNLSMARMTKTVSFNFGERKSRLSQFEIATSPQNQEKPELRRDQTHLRREHEYEPIGTSPTEEKSSDHKEVSPNESQTTTVEVDSMKQAEDMQKELEDRFFTSPIQTTGGKTPHMEIEVAEMEAEEADTDAVEIVKTEKKGFMASAQDRTRRMQAGFKNQAGKLKTKLKPAPKKIPSASPKSKDRKKFKAPEFSKIKMPDMMRPDMSKFKDFKRPEFTKFTKPDISKFKLPEKMTNIKLRRTKSLKEPDATKVDVDSAAMEVEEIAQKEREIPAAPKKLFEFNFGTYPRALRKKKPVEVESSFGTATATEATSLVPSSETQPSLESSSTPQGDRGPGPVRSRWADKFSDVSYNDSEGSRYRRYGSEQESFDRESSLERRMRDDLEDAVSEETNLGILGGVADNKQFAEFDEENRAIHEISNLRSGEFRRRPIVHQDSDVRSEDSKDAVGWTEKEIQKNILLRKAEREAEASFHKFHADDIGTQETQSTASSGKKVVLEEIGDDEFFLRKRGISQDNIEINQYIRNELREGQEKSINALQQVGQNVSYADYDVPPPKPRRLHRAFASDNISQEFDAQRSDFGDDLSISHNGSDFFGAPRKPLRKRRSRSKYSMESQDIDGSKYMDEEYLRDPLGMEDSGAWNDLNMSEKENISHQYQIHQPLPPRRQKRRHESSMDKDLYANGFSGRSVSNSFLPPTENIIVYRTEHEYHHVPLATPDKYSDSASTRKSLSNYDLEERQSRGAVSFEQNEDIQESEKYIIDMMENDGYAVVRKESVPKPTPPARRKKFLRSPGERFATMPNMRTKRSTPPPERPPPPRGYTPVSDAITVTGRKSALSLDAQPNYEDDYEEPGAMDRNLQSGDIINKMKYRPLPPPPRPPREKRQRSISKGSEALPEYRSYDSEDVVDVVDGNLAKRETSPIHVEEVEACTQTDPLPDDFVCEEFEITEDMKIIEPRIRPTKTVQEMLKEELLTELNNVSHQVIDSDQLAKGLQRFRDANQRSLSEKSRASSQADRSKSLSRPQTPSAIIIERQSSTPIQKDDTQVVQASLVVRPIDDLELEEEELRREGLLTDSSQHSVSDTKEDYHNLAVSEASYAPSSAELDEALGILTSDPETQQTDEEVEKTLQRYRDELDAIGRELMETQTTSQEPSPSASREEIKLSDREMEPSDREEQLRSDVEEIISDVEYKDESTLSEIQVEPEELTISEAELPASEPPQPPPRRKSTTLEQSPPLPLLEEPFAIVTQTASERPLERAKQSQAIKEPVSRTMSTPPPEDSTLSQKELTPMQTIARPELPTEHQMPARVGDLEVERLRVHALQAGQIMVSQLHGQQISSDELECKSGNLIVQNIELPPGLIENIVKQVRQKEMSQHLTTETQTSLQGSTEYLSLSPAREIVPPPKPPRLRDQQQHQQTTANIPSSDEQTQTDQLDPQAPSTATPLPAVFPTAEYLQSLAPLAFYNLHRAATGAADDINLDVRPTQRNRRHHRRSSSSDIENRKLSEMEDETRHRRRTRSTRSTSSDENESVTKAGRKFITACSFFLCKIVNQLTEYISDKQPKDGADAAPPDVRSKQVPALVVLFLVVTFAILLYLMSGRSVHTHHWDYFNPPGQEGR